MRNLFSGEQIVIYLSIYCLQNTCTQRVPKSFGVTEFVVIPGDNLNQAVADHSAALCVKYGSTRFAYKICGNHFVFCITQNALQRTFRSFPSSPRRPRRM